MRVQIHPAGAEQPNHFVETRIVRVQTKHERLTFLVARVRESRVGAQQCADTLNATGTATFTTSALAVGTHQISAVYAGSTTHATSTSNTVAQIVYTSCIADKQNASPTITNGQSIWKQDKLAHRKLSTPLAGADTVAVGDLEGYVHFLARETGAFVARESTSGGAVRAAPLRLGAGLLVQTEDGGLFALSL